VCNCLIENSLAHLTTKNARSRQYRIKDIYYLPDIDLTSKRRLTKRLKIKLIKLCIKGSCKLSVHRPWPTPLQLQCVANRGSNYPPFMENADTPEPSSLQTTPFHRCSRLRHRRIPFQSTLLSRQIVLTIIVVPHLFSPGVIDRQARVPSGSSFGSFSTSRLRLVTRLC